MAVVVQGEVGTLEGDDSEPHLGVAEFQESLAYNAAAARLQGAYRAYLVWSVPSAEFTCNNKRKPLGERVQISDQLL